MVYFNDTGILRAGDLRLKYIGKYTIDANYKDLFLTVIDTRLLKTKSQVQTDIVLMQIIIDLVKSKGEDINREEIDKFIQGGFLYGKDDTK